MNTYLIPVSIKGIVIEDGEVWLRKNERDEWEIPGGKLETGEQPEETVVREMREELGFETEVIDIIQSHLYTVKKNEDESHGVLVVSYLCRIKEKVGAFELMGEGGKAEFEKFPSDKIEDLHMPEFYKKAITKAFTQAS